MLSTFNTVSPLTKLQAINMFQTASALSTSNEICQTQGNLNFINSNFTKNLPGFLKKKKGITQMLSMQC